MNEFTGWILDIYPHPKRGIVLWLLCADGQRRRLVQDFSVTFYAAGPSHRLRDLWRYLEKQSPKMELARSERRDLFTGTTVVLSATLDSPSALPFLFQTLIKMFPDLTFYDADLHVALRHAAIYRTFPLAHCHIVTDEKNAIRKINVLDSKWDIDPKKPPLRVLTIEPDVDPFHNEPKMILIHSQKNTLSLDLEKETPLLGFLGYLLRQNDPDLIITAYGDTWLLPLLLKLSGKRNHPLPFNRDPDGEINYRKERSYFAYNQVIYRGQQIHLAGRLHLDIHNTVMYGDYGMDGVLEMARVTSLPIQTVARVSPGTGVSAMQIVKALENEILVPFRKEQVERPKATSELFRNDMGGTVYDPITGFHEDVAEIDFFSMYPSIMVAYNISPETVGKFKPNEDVVAGLEKMTEDDKPGLIPQTLAPLLDKRFDLKMLLLTLPLSDCRYKNYKAQAAAHKWLLVTCFGYLGYKNARFGKIEAHEAVTAYGREVLLRAKETAEDMGYRVLHLYVDGMWVQRSGYCSVQDFRPLLHEIKTRTSLQIVLDGIYKWIAFLSSRQNNRIAVPNRYFGVFQNGEIKMRGIETRRRDTPMFIRETQMQILHTLAKSTDANSLKDCLPEIRKLVCKQQRALRSGRIPPEKLVIHQVVSRKLEEFKTPSPVSTVLEQLNSTGKSLRPGQSVRFIYTLGVPCARAWDLPFTFDMRTVDIPRYRRLLNRAVDSVMEPIVGADRSWLTQVEQLNFYRYE
ncbi:MAG: DNA polymerase domain-containing protein [Anaerolineales bacterium]|nr:DNA polymerase domain-containing protein [Anaerolineales bacterium]